jgi:putative FmdB family regulatory protein
MPLYEYRCLTCGERFERLMKWEAPPPPCPACGGTTKKLPSIFGVKDTSKYLDMKKLMAYADLSPPYLRGA